MSVGGDFTWIAVRAMADAAAALRETGDFSVLDVSVPVRDWFAR